MLRVLKSRHTVHCVRDQIAGLVRAGKIPRRGSEVARPAAVAHARHEEEAEEVVDVDAVGVQGAVDVLVEDFAGAGRDQAVRETVVHKELAASAFEGPEVVVVCCCVARVEAVGELHDRVVVGAVVPVGVVKDKVLDVFCAEGVGFCAGEDDGPLEFGAGLEAGEDEGLVCVDVVGVDVGQGLDLGYGQAGGGVGGVGGAEEGLEEDVAASGVGDDVVAEAVLGIALALDFALDEREERWVDAAG